MGGATGRQHAWGKSWRGPEVSGVGKSEATIRVNRKDESSFIAFLYLVSLLIIIVP